MFRLIALLLSHGATLGFGVGLGIYLLPILTAAPTPDAAILEERASAAMFEADFTRDLLGSDFLHWGEGRISITETQIIHQGRLAPGPDYKLYLLPEFVEDEASFLAIKNSAIRIGDIRSFDGFVLDIPAEVDVNQYTTVLVWCEAFSEFITAAQYR